MTSCVIRVSARVQPPKPVAPRDVVDEHPGGVRRERERRDSEDETAGERIAGAAPPKKATFQTQLDSLMHMDVTFNSA